jgi:polyhydroxyalkanoate synthase
MGGNLALALAARRGRELAGLCLLATPWDFHAARSAHARAAASAMAVLMPAVEAMRAVPVDLLQAFFAANDPLLALRKFAAFGKLDMDGEAARHFVALEDWLNDGVALPHRIARECFADWYGANLTAKGDWKVGGQPVRPDGIEVPSLVVIPDRDRIVPPPSAERLARALPGAERRVARAGHIGMVTGSGAQRHTYRPVVDWLSRLPPW